ncbi:hypothetical protein Q2T41_02220 [Maribacter confluentis]|uniref:Lipocalin-like domain-containing protein n=1 Tax=Maribacter confluentis TaxID=1656093 RepID=A0ABT8RKH5_9FLAO|nr:hypothetical protein [Maribacter confluentis]MDO1511480.1 hypothetical protein [Maribacter confluentis]
MKKIIGLIALLLILVSAASTNTLKTDYMHTIEGTWELESFYNYDGQQVIDTVPTTDGYRQVKMYYNGKIMWSRYVPVDKVGRFGYGTYHITEDRLVETLEYGDNEMIQAMDTMRIFTFELMLSDDKFSQISLDEEGNRTFSENYKRID